MRSILKDKRGQIDYPIVTFAVIVVGLLILAPISLKIFRSFSTPFANNLGNITNGGDIARANFEKVTGTLITFWDKVIIAAFVLALLLLFVSAFFIDANPFFIVLYIFLNLMLILFSPNIIQAVDHIYDSSAFAGEVTYLPFLDALRNNFTIFLVGIMVITGIIIYGKLALFGGGKNSNRR